jgi:type I restriction enzyme S subunit
LQSGYGKQYFLACAKKTSNLASINSKQVKAFPLQLQPVSVQQKIVDERERLERAQNAVLMSQASLSALMQSITGVLG